MSIQLKSVLTAIIASVTLASCGGGSSGGPAPPPPPPPNSAALPITGDNAQDITAAVLDAATSVAELVSVTDFIGMTSANATEVVACDTGDVTVTWTDSDNSSTVSTGDTFEGVFDDCFTGASATTVNGTVSLTNLVISGDPINEVAPWALSMTLGLADLTVADTDGAVTTNGDLDVDSASDDNIIVFGGIDSTLITIRHSSGISEEMADYTIAQTVDMSTLSSAIDTSGIFASTVLEGSVNFETLQSFEAVANANPFSGEMLINDATSSVLITVIDDVNIQLEIDLELDGIVDRTIVIGWVDLGL